MAKQFKHPRIFSSHVTRKIRRNDYRHFPCTTCEVFVNQSELGVNNTIVTTSTSKTIDLLEEFDNYKVTDFSVNNMQAVGANLTPMYVTPNRIDSVDKATEFVGKLDIDLPDNNNSNN